MAKNTNPTSEDARTSLQSIQRMETAAYRRAVIGLLVFLASQNERRSYIAKANAEKLK